MADTKQSQADVPAELHMTYIVFRLVKPGTLAAIRNTASSLKRTDEEIAAAWLDYVAEYHVEDK